MKYILEERFILTEDDPVEATTDIDTETATETAITTNGPKDWQALLNDAADSKTQKDVEKIWEQYYKEEWGPDAQHIKDLGEAFTMELTNLGFTENLNPFITFVKKIFAKKIYPDSNQYGAIHNSFNARRITKEMLKGTGLLGDNNIIFNTSLYTYKSVDILDYIKYWDEGIATCKTSDLAEDEVLRAKYAVPVSNKVKDIGAYIKDAFFVGGDTRKPEAIAKTPGTLKPLTQIKNTLEDDFADGLSDNKTEVEADIETILKDFVAGDKQKAKAAISYIAKQSYKDANSIKKAIGQATKNDFKVDNNLEIDFVGWLKTKRLALKFKNAQEALMAIGKGAGIIE